MSYFSPDAMLSAATALAPSLLGGGRTTGGKLREQRRVKMQELRQSPTNIRIGAERAGFNPLVFAAPTGWSPTPTAAGEVPMGDSIARAGAVLASDKQEQRALDMQRAQLEIERERLEALREEVKLSPNVPGIYSGSARRGGTTRTGGADAASPVDPTEPMGKALPPRGRQATNPATPEDLGQSADLQAPGRNVMVMDYSTGAGVTELNSAWTNNDPVVVPGSDGEPWGIDEVLTGVVFGTPQVMYNGAKKVTDKIKDRVETTWKKRRKEGASKAYDPGPQAHKMTDKELRAAIRGKNK